ncbi:hypothetical protein HQ590_11505 [bacterium]|nr:hypothetical protein [bacterium]
MNWRRWMVAVAMLALAGGSLAQAQAPIQLALWPPDLQLVKESDSVKGLRLSVYGSNENMSGLDLGFANETIDTFAGVALGLVSAAHGDMHGLQWVAIYAYTGQNAVGWPAGIVTKVDGDFKGLSTGVVTLNEGNATGVELAGLYNYTGQHITGVQVGLVNRANSVKGLQLGLVNLTEQMAGLQIGLWNQIEAKEDWQVIPIVNWQF